MVRQGDLLTKSKALGLARTLRSTARRCLFWGFFCVLLDTFGTRLGFAKTPYAMRLSGGGLAEAAASLGSLGIRLSGGVTRLPYPDEELFQSGQRGLKPTKNPLVQRLGLAKGLSIPINIGMMINHLADMGWLDVTAYLQWTIYEAHARPAFAVRTHYGKSFGIERTQLSTVGMDAVGSYGFFRYFALFGVIGIRRQEIVVHEEEFARDPNGSPIRPSGLSRAIQKELELHTLGELGLQIVLIPTVAAMTLASSIDEDHFTYHTLKWTFAI